MTIKMKIGVCFVVLNYIFAMFDNIDVLINIGVKLNTTLMKIMDFKVDWDFLLSLF